MVDSLVEKVPATVRAVGLIGLVFLAGMTTAATVGGWLNTPMLAQANRDTLMSQRRTLVRHDRALDSLRVWADETAEIPDALRRLSENQCLMLAALNDEAGFQRCIQEVRNGDVPRPDFPR